MAGRLLASRWPGQTRLMPGAAAGSNAPGHGGRLRDHSHQRCAMRCALPESQQEADRAHQPASGKSSLRTLPPPAVGELTPTFGNDLFNLSPKQETLPADANDLDD